MFTRVAYLSASAIGLSLISTLFYHPEARQKFLEPYAALDGLCRWDCGWMVHLVQDGYPTAEYAKVFPLFPLIGWAVEKATGVHHLLVFLVVSNLCSLASYYVIFGLFRRIENEESARWGLMLMAAYPFAFFQATAQPESMAMLLTAVSVSLAMRGKHLRAGTALGLGVMARHVAIFYGLALVVAQVRQRSWDLRRLFWHPAILGLGIPFCFVGGFSLYLQLNPAIHDPLAWWNARTIGWGELVWSSWLDVIRKIPYSDRAEYYHYMIIGLFPLVGAVALLWRKRWFELAAAGLVPMLFFYGSGVVGLGRYSASVWPAFLPLGVFIARRPTWQGPALIAFALLQGVYFFMFSHQFRVF